VIVEFRRAVYDALGSSSIPVYLWPPDDVAHLPCHVVGRPAVRESGLSAGLATLELGVTLLGRRIGDDDAQAELDALADELMKVLGGTRNREINGLHLRCVAMDPGTVTVAALEIPAYVATVNSETLTC
jgi:hypothetical protein